MRTASSAAERVLSHLLEQQAALTRPMMATACELSRPTVFAAISRLEELDLVRNIGQRSGGPGRSATLYEVSPAAGVLAAVDIGGSNTRAAVTDVRGQILAQRREPTAPGGAPPIMAHAAEMVRTLLASVPVETGRLKSVAVSVPGVLDRDGGTVHYAINISQFTPFDFRGGLRAALGAEVTMENNVNLAAMGERWRGAARDLSTFAVVAVGAGIGAGIVHDGQLLRGAHGAAGEVAFLPPYGGRIRDHTMRKDEAGGLRLLEEATSRSDWRTEPPATVEELFRRAAEGEETATTLVENECRRIASVIAAVCAVVDPEMVVLTGGVGGNDALIERAGELVSTMTAFPPEVVRSELGERASLVGAIWLATQVAQRDLLGSIG